MNMRAHNLIHGLTFDISFAGTAADSLELADWIKAALLPVMEEVFEQHDRQGELRRIEQMEIDLGTVSQDDSRVELARRLFARLSEALGWSLESATATSLVEEREQQLGDQLLDFLRTGRLAWAAAADTRSAHLQLLRRVLESNHAEEVLRTAVGDPQMLSRLVLQFDPGSLRSVAEVLTRFWTEQERAALYGAELADGASTQRQWRHLLQSSARAPVSQGQGQALLQMRRLWADLSLSQRDALRVIWPSLAEHIRRRLGNRPMAVLNPDAKTDLTLLLRRHALELFGAHGEEWPPERVETALQLLLAGDDAIASADMLRQVDIAAAGTIAGSSEAETRPAEMHASVNLLERMWNAFDPAQRGLFRVIWLRLISELTNLTGGRALAALDSKQRAELAVQMRANATSLFKETGWKWPDSITPRDEKNFVLSTVRLLLAGDSAAERVTSMLADTRDLHPVLHRTGERSVATLSSAQKSDPALIVGVAAEAGPKGLWRRRAIADVATRDHEALQDQQVSMAQLASVLQTLAPAQREAIDDILARLAGEVASRTRGRQMKMLSAVQKTDLALTLRPLARAMLINIRRQWPALISQQEERDIVELVLHLLLAKDASVTVASILTGVNESAAMIVRALAELDGTIVAAASAKAKGDGDAFLGDTVADIADDTRAAEEPVAEAATRYSDALQEKQAAMARLASVFRKLEPAQRQVFEEILAQLTSEVASRAAGRPTKMLSAVQKTDLALTLRPIASAMLRNIRRQWPALISSQNERDIVQSVLHLLLAEDAIVAVASILSVSNETATTTAEPDAAIAAAASAIAQRDSEACEVDAVAGVANDNWAAEARVAAATTRYGGTLQDQQTSMAQLASVFRKLAPAQREAFEDILARLASEVASRTRGRAKKMLSAVQKTDLALTLRPMAGAMLINIRRKWPALISAQDESDIVQSVLNLLLAEDATVTVASILSIANQTVPAPAKPDAAIVAAASAIAQRDSEASEVDVVTDIADDNRAAGAPLAAATTRYGGASQDQEGSMTQLASVFRRLVPAQRQAIDDIVARLASEVTSRTGGRPMKMLSAVQKTDLGLALRPMAAAMLINIRRQWPALISPQDERDIVQSVLHLLLTEDTTVSVASILSVAKQTAPTTGEPDAAIVGAASAIAQRDSEASEGDAVADIADDNRAAGALLAAVTTRYGGASQDQEGSMTQLASVFRRLVPAQRQAIDDILARLASEVTSRTGGRPMKMLSAVQKTDLGLALRPMAAAMLINIRRQWPALISPQDERDIVQSVLHLLLAEDTTVTVASILSVAKQTAPTTGEPDAAIVGAASAIAQRDSEASEGDAVADIADDNRAAGAPLAAVTTRYGGASQDQEASMTQLASVFRRLVPTQRQAIDDILARLASEVTSRTGGRPMKMLSAVQKTDLGLALRPMAAAMLINIRRQWPALISPQDERDIVQSVLHLLLAEDATVTVASILSVANQPVPAPAEPDAAIGAAASAIAQRDVDAVADISDDNRATEAHAPEAARRYGDASQDQHAGMAQMESVSRKLEPAQREAIEDTWDRFANEVTSRTNGRAMEMLSALQKTQLALALQSAPMPEEPDKAILSQRQSQPQEAEHRVAAQLSIHSAMKFTEKDLDALSVAAGHPPQEIHATIDPSLAAFRDWQQGKLDILAQPMALADLRKWLDWWMLHAPQHAGQDRSLMLSAIEARARDVADPVLFMKFVLCALSSGDPLDLEEMALRSDHRDDDALPQSAECIPHQASALREALQSPASLQQFIAGQDPQLLGLNSAQLHQLIRGWLHLQHADGAAPIFLTAIEAHAQEAASVHAFFSQLLQMLISGQPVDLEQLLVDTGIDAQVLVTEGSHSDEAIHEHVPAADPPAMPAVSALPAQLRQALPQRLATAMLKGDLASLEIIWPEIVRSHSAELAEAARRYLGRSELRTRLIAGTDIAKLKDLLGVLSSSSLQLAEPLLQHSVQCGAMLASPLASAEFEQRVLRFAFEQALKPETGAMEWLHALMSSIQEMSEEQRKELQHAWYEVLRSAQRPTPLLWTMEKDLFPRHTHGRTAQEPLASLLLMRAAEPDEDERTVLAALLQRVISVSNLAPEGALESALSEPQAIDRLADILPSPAMARLFATLRPGLAAQLPALLRQLHQSLPITLAPVPATLARHTWRAIYLAAFADDAADAPADFARALVVRLAGQHRQADTELWLAKAAGAASIATEAAAADSTVKPEQAMAGLLQPWAEPKAETPVGKPAPSTRGEDEPLPLTGESNIHNAGLVIVVPYVQRLFGLLELTVDGKFVSKEAAQRGVHLLQYVVTGEESTPEYLLALNKLLCGIHGGEPIVPGISITDKEKTIIEQMLNGVITHWSALGTTSINGLRETFLQRQGNLYFQDDAWQLKIPQKTFDMLLDRLPWSFALTKMPWMAQPLHVTWR